jgi:hypothetical protein
VTQIFCEGGDERRERERGKREEHMSVHVSIVAALLFRIPTRNK